MSTSVCVCMQQAPIERAKFAVRLLLFVFAVSVVSVVLPLPVKLSRLGGAGVGASTSCGGCVCIVGQKSIQRALMLTRIHASST